MSKELAALLIAEDLRKRAIDALAEEDEREWEEYEAAKAERTRRRTGGSAKISTTVSTKVRTRVNTKVSTKIGKNR